jgi:hypothetical protein
MQAARWIKGLLMLAGAGLALATAAQSGSAPPDQPGTNQAPDSPLTASIEPPIVEVVVPTTTATGASAPAPEPVAASASISEPVSAAPMMTAPLGMGDQPGQQTTLSR